MLMPQRKSDDGAWMLMFELEVLDTDGIDRFKVVTIGLNSALRYAAHLISVSILGKSQVHRPLSRLYIRILFQETWVGWTWPFAGVGVGGSTCEGVGRIRAAAAFTRVYPCPRFVMSILYTFELNFYLSRSIGGISDPGGNLTCSVGPLRKVPRYSLPIDEVLHVKLTARKAFSRKRGSLMPANSNAAD